MSKTSIYLWTSFIVFLFTFCSVSKDWATVPENNLKRNIGLLKAPSQRMFWLPPIVATGAMPRKIRSWH